jgi:5-methylcytosine-specific restriction endonuclease McrA
MDITTVLCGTCGKKTPNRKFCSRRCSAIHTNRHHPRRSKGYVSPNDNNGHGYRDQQFTYTDDELRQVVLNSISLRQAIIALTGKTSKSAYNHVRKHIVELNVDLSHFLGQGHNKVNRVKTRTYITNEELFVNGRKRGDIKKRLFSEGFKEQKCEWCGLVEWREQPVSLELDHIDGDVLNNLIENLRILCPNCHAQTPTYRGRNMHKSTRPYKYKLVRIEE